MPPLQRSNHHLLPPDAQPCIWMSAGLLTYKLCDHALDCERCPLDAALRGKPLSRPAANASDVRHPATWDLRDDCLYASGHVWVRLGGRGRLQVGVDSFAVQLIDAVTAVMGPKLGVALASGDTLCVLETEIGNLTIRAPCRGVVLACNPALRDKPRLILDAPQDEGWLAELGADETDRESQLAGLISSAAARDRVRLDLQRFRRQVAMHLLESASKVGPTLADGGERLTTLPQMLGPRRYLGIVQELLS